MSTNKPVIDQLENIFGQEKARQLPLFIQLAKLQPAMEDSGYAMKIARCDFHNTNAHQLYAQAKPISRLYPPDINEE